MCAPFEGGQWRRIQRRVSSAFSPTTVAIDVGKEKSSRPAQQEAGGRGQTTPAGFAGTSAREKQSAFSSHCRRTKQNGAKENNKGVMRTVALCHPWVSEGITCDYKIVFHQ